MPSALDLRIDQAIESLSQEGGPLPLDAITLPSGLAVPIFAGAPPTLAAYFEYFCALHGALEFIIDGPERLSFAQVHAAASRVAQALVSGYGVQKGDRVGIAMRNAPSWIVIYMGILMAGGVATLLNGWWQGEELCAGIADVGAGLVFADPSRATRIAGCDGDHRCELVPVDVALPLDEALAPLLARGGGGILPEIGPDDLATLLFTSGSTGRAKGACSTHRAVVQGVMNYLAQALVILRIGTEDGTIARPLMQHCILMTLPLFHVTGEIVMLLVSFAIGRKIVLMHKWDAREAMALIEAERATMFTGVPLMSWEILNHPDRDRFDLSTVQQFSAGGAPRPPDHVRRLNDEMPAPPMIGYGLTETNAVGAASFLTNYLAKPNSTGRASAPLVHLAILDDDGRPVPQGERGEVCIRSVANFSSYWNNPQATAAAMTTDGFFRSGDIGYLDADGYLFIVDRKKDIIIRGGENISCQEVEAAIYAHPAIAEACVFGLPDERLGEIPGAVVHFYDGEHLSDEALRFFLSERIAAFKIPVRIWHEDAALPRLGTEKIDKVGLRTRFRAEYASECQVEERRW